MNYLINETNYDVGIQVEKSSILAWGGKEVSQRGGTWQSPPAALGRGWPAWRVWNREGTLK